MSILTSASITIAACRVIFALYTMIAGHDPMPPYGGYSGEGVECLCAGSGDYNMILYSCVIRRMHLYLHRKRIECALIFILKQAVPP